jgi:serine/threonine protein phosphatase PrpC
MVSTTLSNTSSFQIESWVGSDLGQVRKKNEDNYLVDALNGLFIVADGMGGGVDGERASRRAIETFSATLYNQRDLLRKMAEGLDAKVREQISELLRKAIVAANQEILQIRKGMGSDVSMGTTISVMLIQGNHAAIAHIGDSRIYRVRYRDLAQLTEDHSLVAQQIRDGYLTPEQAKYSPFRNVILQAIGKGEKIDPQIEFFSLEIGDQFLLCSDGLHSYLTDDEIITVMAEPAGHRIVPRLIDCANARGGSDNITAIAIRLSSSEHYIPTTEVDVGQSLTHSPLLRGLKPLETTRLLQLGQTQDYIAGERITTEDAAERSLYLIFDGQVGLYRGGIWLATLETGQHFGLYALVDGKGRLMSAQAETQVRLLEIAREELLDLLRRDPNLGVKIIWNLLKDMSVAHRQTVSRLLKALSSEKDEE